MVCRFWDTFYLISIHAPREGCDADVMHAGHGFAISIHAPREGCDRMLHEVRVSRLDFNPRTP